METIHTFIIATLLLLALMLSQPASGTRYNTQRESFSRQIYKAQPIDLLARLLPIKPELDY